MNRYQATLLLALVILCSTSVMKFLSNHIIILFILESILGKIVLPKKANLIFDCINKHLLMPIDEFNKYYIALLLDNVPKESSIKVFMLGDFNIDFYHLNFVILFESLYFLSNVLNLFLLSPRFLWQHML